MCTAARNAEFVGPGQATAGSSIGASSLRQRIEALSHFLAKKRGRDSQRARNKECGRAWTSPESETTDLASSSFICWRASFWRLRGNISPSSGSLVADASENRQSGSFCPGSARRLSLHHQGNDAGRAAVEVHDVHMVTDLRRRLPSSHALNLGSPEA